MAEWIKPKRLQPGDRIGIVSPSYWMPEENLRSAVNYLESIGFNLVLGDSNQLRNNIYAGTPQQRADDLMSMFADPSIDAIFCARGGYGGNRVLPLLDYDVIRSNPKIFMGFSDITGYLSSIAQQSKLVCFHGPMLANFVKNQHAYNERTMWNVLSGEDNIEVTDDPKCQAKTLKTGRATGELWGGNLSLLNERLGTHDQIDTNDKILLIEEVGEKFYAFDRMLLHIKRSGSLDSVKGIIFGEMTEMGDTKIPFGKDTDDIILDVCSELDIPIISNFPCGHGDLMATLPIGHQVELVADETNSKILIPESPVT